MIAHKMYILLIIMETIYLIQQFDPIDTYLW